jgi:hypothetical protein
MNLLADEEASLVLMVEDLLFCYLSELSAFLVKREVVLAFLVDGGIAF